MQARISIKQKQYRNQDGFLIYGHNDRGSKISIFTRSRASAEQIRICERNNQPIPRETWDIK